MYIWNALIRDIPDLVANYSLPDIFREIIQGNDVTPTIFFASQYLEQYYVLLTNFV